MTRRKRLAPILLLSLCLAVPLNMLPGAAGRAAADPPDPNVTGVTFDSVADTYAHKLHEDDSFGSAETMMVKNEQSGGNPGYNYRKAFLQFDASSAYAYRSVIESVYVNVYGWTSGAPVRASVFGVGDNWEEDNLTWNNMVNIDGVDQSILPNSYASYSAKTGFLTDFEITGTSANNKAWHTIDVTGYVLEQLDGQDATISLMIESARTGNYTMSLNTKESTDASDVRAGRPYMQVNIRSDAFAEIRERQFRLLTGYDPASPYDPNDPDVAAKLAAIGSDAQRMWDMMNTDSSSWNDTTSGPFMDLLGKENNVMTEGVGYNVQEMLARLRAMALGWATVGSSLHGEPGLAEDIAAALQWIDTYRYGTSVPDLRGKTNWYTWEYAIPNRLNDTVVLMHDALPDSQIQSHMAAEDRYTSADPLYHNYSTTPPFNNLSTGGNLSLQLQVLAVRAALGRDAVKLQLVSDAMDELFPYRDSGANGNLGVAELGDGMYTDGSFIQHNSKAYIGTYGATFFSGTFLLLYLTEGTPWASDSPEKENALNWFRDAAEPHIYRNTYLNSVMGRQIAGNNNNPSNAMNIVKQLLMQLEFTSDPAEESELKGIVKAHFLNAPNMQAVIAGSSLWQIPKIRAILNDPAIAPLEEPTGQYQPYNMDRAVHRTEDWVFNIAAHSSRTTAYESINTNNLKSWYSADGMSYLYTDPRDYAYGYWATVDPHRLPGITVDRDPGRPGAAADNKGLHPWVGGSVLDSMYGAYGMDFEQHDYSNMDLKARKSWFMFDDEVVALGADIRSTSGRPIETVVDNRGLDSFGANELTVNGVPQEIGEETEIGDAEWIHLEGTGGYLFPEPTSIQLLKEERRNDGYDRDQQNVFAGTDEFNVAEFQQAMWRIVSEDGSHHRLTGTHQEITTQTGSLAGTSNNLHNLFLTKTPPQDFAIMTKVEFDPVDSGQSAGLILYQDDDNYVSLSRASGDIVLAVNEQNGVYTEQQMTVTDATYLSIEKRGSRFDLYASDDEQQQGVRIAEFTNPIGDNWYANDNLQMGIFAQNGANGAASEIPASFDYFRFAHLKSFMTIWKDHGIDPQGDTYSYILLPGMSAQEVADYNDEPDVEIVANTKEVQAVAEKTLGVAGLNFWQPATLGDIKAYHPLSMMMKDDGEALDIAVSDPTQLQDKVIVELAKYGTGIRSKDDTVHVLSLNPIVFEVDTSVKPGSTHHVAFDYDADEESSFLETELDRVDLQVSVGGKQADQLYKVMEHNPQLDVSAYLNDNSRLDLANATVTFSSSNPQVADVVYGNLALLSGGEIELTVTVTYEGKTMTDMETLQIVDGEQLKLEPIEDAYVRGGEFADTSFQQDSAESAWLRAKSGSGATGRQAYLKFDLESLLQSDYGQVDSVLLNLYGATMESVTGKVKVYNVDDQTWSEETLTWNTKPAEAELIANNVPIAVAKKGVFEWQQIDLTAFLQQAYADNQRIVSITLMGAPDQVAFSSKESLPQNRPYLEAVMVPYKLNLALDQSYSASTTYTSADSGTDKAADGNRQTWWRNNSKDTAPWWKIDLGVSTPFNEIVMREYLSSGAYRIYQYRIETSDDNVNWTLLQEDGQSGVPGIVIGKIKRLNFATVSARYVRFSILDKDPTNIAGLFEFELYHN